jgi:hypothetical protein
MMRIRKICCHMLVFGLALTATIVGVSAQSGLSGNVPNLVDPETGGWGRVLLDPNNSTQTTTLASLNTLGSLITAYANLANDDWCARLLKAAILPDSPAPKSSNSE